jgi:alkylated DNA repair dioxygenase AlkB
MFSEYENSPVSILIENDGLATYFPNFIEDRAGRELFDLIIQNEAFQQTEILLFGKKMKVPRLEAFYSLNGESYSYSGQTLPMSPLPKYLNKLRELVEGRTGYKYNALLINFYRNGMDSNGWHSDDEKSLGQNPSIASISLGAARRFDIRHKRGGSVKKIILENGSLLHMHGAMQHNYKHQLPKIPQLLQARINLTFRWIEASR